MYYNYYSCILDKRLYIYKSTIIAVFVAILMCTQANAMSMDDAKRTKLATEIATVVLNNAEEKDFLPCISTADPKVYAIILDKEKMKNLKDLPLEDLKKIDKVVKSCKVK